METETENSWREFEQTGSIRSYLKYKGMGAAAPPEDAPAEPPQGAGTAHAAP